MPAPEQPSRDCPLCPRLAAYRAENRAAHADWHNAPVPPFGAVEAEILIVGMAPGLSGANRTGRPFTGDHAGKLLYRTLLRLGLAHGTYGESADDGLSLENCRITNAVRCAPPANLPTPEEAKTCNRFLLAELQAMTNLRAVLALGVLAHAAVLRASGMPLARARFRHGAIHELPDGLLIADSYHVSRYNTSTGRLTEEMFASVVFALRRRLEQAA
ncbi:MAG TPA: uracil-DNA glycosylase [Acetobacteraceae bacterium]|nr:uracil-DNA glycosylase [Acetobacteraceae bacterium]